MQLVRCIWTILLSITPLMLSNTRSIITLTMSRETSSECALRFVESIATLNGSIADLASRNTLSIVASELGLRARTGGTSTRGIELVGVVSTIVLSIAHPASRNTLSSLGASEFSDVVASRTALLILVGVVSTIILSIAERPVGDASVGGGAASPSLLALDLSTLWGLIGAVSTIIVVVASPRLRNALVIVASELFGGAVSVRRHTQCICLV